MVVVAVLVVVAVAVAVVMVLLSPDSLVGRWRRWETLYCLCCISSYLLAKEDEPIINR
jgi:hypothetical protein